MCHRDHIYQDNLISVNFDVSSVTEVEIVDKVDLALDHPLKTSSAKAKVLEMLESKPLGGTLKALKNNLTDYFWDLI